MVTEGGPVTADILSFRNKAVTLWLGIPCPLTAALACAKVHLCATGTECIADSPLSASWGYMAASRIKMQICAGLDVISSVLEPLQVACSS